MADQRGGDIIQKWAAPARHRPPDRDRPLPGVARRAWCRRRRWRNRLFRKHLTDRPWTPGDNINFAVGQGDLRPTRCRWRSPTARSRTAARRDAAHRHARRGLGRPRAAGDRPGPERASSTSRPTTAQAIMAGLRAAANDPGGTSAPVFEGFPIESRARPARPSAAAQGDQSWYVVVAPYNDPRAWSRSRSSAAASAPRRPPRRPAGSSPRTST